LRAKYCPKAEFKSLSDCEIIIHLYEAGYSVVEIANLLNGIFAFILLDEEKDCYYLCRDHIGIMPLYAGRDSQNNHWIASEMKALHDVCAPENKGQGFACDDE
jgi:asparagine synthase (glutamine-hydrolysing)